MGLVSDHHYVAPVRKDGVAVAIFARCKLLQRGEDDATRSALELRPQVGAGRRLYRRLRQDACWSERLAEKLVIEVIAVGDEH